MAYGNRASSGAHERTHSPHVNVAAVALRGMGQFYDINLAATRAVLQAHARTVAALGWPDYSDLFTVADDRIKRVFSTGTEQLLETAQHAQETLGEVQRQVGRLVECQTVNLAENWQRGIEELGTQTEQSLSQLSEATRRQVDELEQATEQLGEAARENIRQGGEQFRQQAREGYEQGRELTERTRQAGEQAQQESEETGRRAQQEGEEAGHRAQQGGNGSRQPADRSSAGTEGRSGSQSSGRDEDESKGRSRAKSA